MFSVKQKNNEIMKKLDEIKQMIDSAQQKLGEIRDLDSLYPLSRFSLCEKKEKLKDFLEDIRQKTEALIADSPRDCKRFLEQILGISECLRASYAFPGYVESYYILDTLRLIDGKYGR